MSERRYFPLKQCGENKNAEKIKIKIKMLQKIKVEIEILQK